MPWQQTEPVNERMKFVIAAREGRESMTDLRARFGISRRTGYKQLRRSEEEDPEGLRDRSSAPQAHPNRTKKEVERQVPRSLCVALGLLESPRVTQGPGAPDSAESATGGARGVPTTKAAPTTIVGAAVRRSMHAGSELDLNGVREVGGRRSASS